MCGNRRRRGIVAAKPSRGDAVELSPSQPATNGRPWCSCECARPAAHFRGAALCAPSFIDGSSEEGEHRTGDAMKRSRISASQSGQSAECRRAAEVHRRPAGPSLGGIDGDLPAPHHRGPPGHVIDLPGKHAKLAGPGRNRHQPVCDSSICSATGHALSIGPPTVLCDAALLETSLFLRRCSIAWLKRGLKTAPLSLAVHHGQQQNRFLGG